MKQMEKGEQIRAYLMLFILAIAVIIGSVMS